MSSREHIYDELLVLRCKEGDSAAFSELVERWQERLWRHAWRLTDDEDAAWDALQEAWIGIVNGIGKLKDDAAFPAWAFRMVGNKCRDWIRRRVRQRRAAETYADRMRDDAEASSEKAQRRSDLKDALARLPGSDRAILSLRYEEGFDTAQIARIMQIPPGTVKSRLYHARERLRARMEDASNE